MQNNISDFINWTRGRTPQEIVEHAQYEMQRLRTYINTGRATPEKGRASDYYREVEHAKIYFSAKMWAGGMRPSFQESLYNIAKEMAASGIISAEELAAYPKA